jgi:hypothetical protein
MHDSTAL